MAPPGRSWLHNEGAKHVFLVGHGAAGPGKAPPALPGLGDGGGEPGDRPASLPAAACPERGVGRGGRGGRCIALA